MGRQFGAGKRQPGGRDPVDASRVDRAGGRISGVLRVPGGWSPDGGSRLRARGDCRRAGDGYAQRLRQLRRGAVERFQAQDRSGYPGASGVRRRRVPDAHRYRKCLCPRAWEEAGWAPPAPQLPSLELKFEGSVEAFIKKVMSQHYMISYGDNRALLEDLCAILGVEVI